MRIFFFRYSPKLTYSNLDIIELKIMFILLGLTQRVDFYMLQFQLHEILYVNSIQQLF